MHLSLIIISVIVPRSPSMLLALHWGTLVCSFLFIVLQELGFDQILEFYVACCFCVLDQLLYVQFWGCQETSLTNTSKTLKLIVLKLEPSLPFVGIYIGVIIIFIHSEILHLIVFFHFGPEFCFIFDIVLEPFFCHEEVLKLQFLVRIINFTDLNRNSKFISIIFYLSDGPKIGTKDHQLVFNKFGILFGIIRFSFDTKMILLSVKL